MSKSVPRNLGLDLVRVTEAAALRAARWMGRGDPARADVDANDAMCKVLDQLPMDGRIVLGEAERLEASGLLMAGHICGTGVGPSVDIALDSIDGRKLLSRGVGGAVSVAVSAPRGTLWAPYPALYMEKLVVGPAAADAIVPECLDAPAAWTLALVARVRGKAIPDLAVAILDRPRHADLIEEVRTAGARVILLPEGDIMGAIMAAMPRGPADLMLGAGGVTEGVIAAAAVKVFGGSMLGRIAPQSAAELDAVQDAGLDIKAILTANELVKADDAFFAATGVTDGPILRGVRLHGRSAETESLLLRGETRTRRKIDTEHLLDASLDYS